MPEVRLTTHCSILQAAEAEVVDSLDDSVDSESDELVEEFEEVKRARSLSSIFTSEDEVLKVDAGQADESLAVCLCQCCVALLLLRLCTSLQYSENNMR